MFNNSENALLISDLAGTGKVALSVQIPLISSFGIECSYLPTAMVSNNFNYKECYILSMTDYIEKTIKIWDNLDFKFDAALIGFIPDGNQIELIEDFLRLLDGKKKLKVIVHDPIMGDEGKLYNGIDDNTVEVMRKMCKAADYITPNYTEACYLAGVEYKKEISSAEGEILCKKLYEISESVVIVTSVKQDGKNCVLIYDGKNLESIEYNHIDLYFSGTGDIFSALLFVKLLKGEDLISSTKFAMDKVKYLIEQCRDMEDPYTGIPVELFLDDLKK